MHTYEHLSEENTHGRTWWVGVIWISRFACLNYESVLLQMNQILIVSFKTSEIHYLCLAEKCFENILVGMNEYTYILKYIYFLGGN